MGFLNPYASDLVDLTLLFQITILVLLVLSMALKYRRKFLQHGVLMSTAMILHIISVVVVMIPSLMNLRGLFENPTTDIALVILSHSLLGSIVLVLGVLLVAAWAISPRKVTGCFKRKRIMDATLILWLVALALGIVTYILFYVPI